MRRVLQSLATCEKPRLARLRGHKETGRQGGPMVLRRLPYLTHESMQPTHCKVAATTLEGRRGT